MRSLRLTETWQAQSAYLQEAQAAGQLKHIGARPPIRGHVLKGMCVLQTLLGQDNTVHRSQMNPGDPNRPDTEGGLVSVPIPAPPAFSAQPLPILCASDCDGAVRLTVMVRSLCR